MNNKFSFFFCLSSKDNEVDELGPLACESAYVPHPGRDPVLSRPNTAPPQQQQHHPTKHTKQSLTSHKPNIADDLHLTTRQPPLSMSDAENFAAHVWSQVEKTRNTNDIASPVSKFQEYEDRPIKPLSTNVLKKQLEGNGGRGKVKKATTPTTRQSSSLPSTPTPRHSTSLPSTPTPRSPHDFHHNSRAGREKGRSSHQTKRSGGSGEPRGSSSQMKSEVKHIKEVASSRKQGKGQSSRHWEVNGNPDYERYWDYRFVFVDLVSLIIIIIIILIVI